MIACLLHLTLPVPVHPQAFWGLEFSAARRGEPFVPANETERLSVVKVQHTTFCALLEGFRLEMMD